MKVTLKVIGPLIYVAGFSEKRLALAAPATAADLLAGAGIERSRPTIITRNGKAITPAEALQDGDRVVVSPIYSGG